MEKTQPENSRKIQENSNKWACAAREARSARPFLGFLRICSIFSGFVFPDNTVAPPGADHLQEFRSPLIQTPEPSPTSLSFHFRNQLVCWAHCNEAIVAHASLIESRINYRFKAVSVYACGWRQLDSIGPGINVVMLLELFCIVIQLTFSPPPENNLGLWRPKGEWYVLKRTWVCCTSS
mgnify:CR=1 FL=1